MSSLKPLSRAATTAGAGTLAAPPALVVIGVFYLIVTSVLSGLWSTAAGASGGSIVGYSTTALVWYIATTEAAVMPLPMRLIETVGDDIGSGRIDVELLRPVSALWLRVASQVGALLPRLALCATVGFAFARTVGGPVPDSTALVLAVPALVLATVLSVIVQHGFATIAFWIRDTKSAWFLYQKLVFVVGGMLLPLEILPSWLETTAKFLPFMAMAYVPGRLASGHVEPWLLLVQGGWLLVAALGTGWLFARGTRRMLDAAP